MVAVVPPYPLGCAGFVNVSVFPLLEATLICSSSIWIVKAPDDGNSEASDRTNCPPIQGDVAVILTVRLSKAPALIGWQITLLVTP